MQIPDDLLNSGWIVLNCSEYANNGVEQLNEQIKPIMDGGGFGDEVFRVGSAKRFLQYYKKKSKSFSC